MGSIRFTSIKQVSEKESDRGQELKNIFLLVLSKHRNSYEPGIQIAQARWAQPPSVVGFIAPPKGAHVRGSTKCTIFLQWLEMDNVCTTNRAKRTSWGGFWCPRPTQVAKPEHPIQGFKFTIASSMNLKKYKDQRVTYQQMNKGNVLRIQTILIYLPSCSIYRTAGIDCLHTPIQATGNNQYSARPQINFIRNT